MFFFCFSGGGGRGKGKILNHKMKWHGGIMKLLKMHRICTESK